MTSSRDHESRLLTLAVPKGRVLGVLRNHLERLGFGADAFDGSSRRLRFHASGPLSLNLLLLKPDDVPTYVAYGAAEMGVVGRDVLLERNYDLYTPVDLGIGRCNLAVAGLPEDKARYRSADPLRVATKFPGITRRFFAENGRRVETVFVQGSVELAPLTGLAHVIVDLVESGATLRDNGLEVFEHIEEISSVVAVNRAAYKLRLEEVTKVLDILKVPE